MLYALYHALKLCVTTQRIYLEQLLLHRLIGDCLWKLWLVQVCKRGDLFGPMQSHWRNIKMTMFHFSYFHPQANGYRYCKRCLSLMLTWWLLFCFELYWTPSHTHSLVNTSLFPLRCGLSTAALRWFFLCILWHHNIHGATEN